jgi:ABC-type glycerol-3-phosphate transport system substrate-binding protein
MKRSIKTGIVSATVLSVLLAGCGQATVPTPQVIEKVVTQVVNQTAVVTVQVNSTTIVNQNTVVTATPEPTVNPYNDTSPIVVWIDAARKPMADLWTKTHPDQASLVKFEIVDRGQFASKVLLFNNSGSGWPDVVFAEASIVMKTADAAHDFPGDLTPWVDPTLLAKYVPGANDPCMTADKKLLCLRNDLAPMVLWYDKTQMDKFGYTVPTTWDEFQALGDKVATEHPGYVLGSAHNEPVTFMWPSGCQIANQLDLADVVINTTDPRCTRVAKMIDHMVANGSLSNLGPFDPKYIALGNTGKILMMVCAAWCGDYVFNGTYYKPEQLKNQLAAALVPKWPDADKAYTGAWGGAAWMVSKHTINPKLAVSIAVYMTTDLDVTQIVGTMPAFQPAADAWAKKLDTSKLYASNPYNIMVQASNMINPAYTDVVRYDVVTAGLAAFNTAVEQKKPTLDTLPDVQKTMTDLAEKEGYNVKSAP